MLNEQQLEQIKDTLFKFLMEENAPHDAHLDEIKQLFSSLSAEEKKQLVDARNKNKHTPLHFAANFGYIEIVQWFAQNGAYINARSNGGNTPLHIAIIEGHTKIVQWFAQNGADINTKNYDDKTPLHIAASEGHTEIVQWLAQNGADINARDRFFYSPLHRALEKSHTEIVQYLTQNSADINTRNNYGESPLHIAASEGHTETVQYLAQHGADINAKDKLNRTIMHFAALESRTEIVKYLLENGTEVPADLVERIGQMNIEGVILAPHPEKQGVFYNENAKIKPWQREGVHEGAVKQAKNEVMNLRDNFFASSLFGFQIPMLEIRTDSIAPYLAKHLFPRDNEVFSPDNLKELVTYAQVCTSWCNSVKAGLAGYLKDKISPEAIAGSGLSLIRQLPVFGNQEYNTRFSDGFVQMLEAQKTENERSKSPERV